MWLDWLVFCEYGFTVFALWCPLATHTVLLGFLLPWVWGMSSRLLQQSATIAPYLGRGVSPHSCPSWPWMWGSSSRLPLLIWVRVSSSRPCFCTVHRSQHASPNQGLFQNSTHLFPVNYQKSTTRRAIDYSVTWFSNLVTSASPGLLVKTEWWAHL